MYSPTRFVLVLALVGWAVASASPVHFGKTIRSSENKKGEIACHRAKDYSAEWFLENTKPEFSQPFLNTALFYSAGMSESARILAAQTGLTTIWDPWPCYLYNYRSEPSNPLRCIHADDKERELFFTHMSRAFAMKARNFSTVLHSADNYGQPPKTGIWGKVEFPVLQRGGVVNWLEKINENKSLSEIFWERSRDFAASMWDSVGLYAGELKKRTVRGKKVQGPPPLPSGFTESCLPRRELRFFDNMPW